MLPRYLIFCVVSIYLAAGFPVHSQSQQERVSAILEERGEVYFSFDLPEIKTLNELGRSISIDRINENTVFAYANASGFEVFGKYNMDFKLLTPPSLLYTVKMKDKVNIKAINDWDFYPTYDAYVDMMYQFEEDYPDLCTIVNIGETINGRDILCAKISDNISISEDEAQFLYTSSIHGDETTGYVLTLRLIDYLLSNYGEDDEVDNLVDNLEIWINPLANPDGTYYTGNASVNGAIRYNANGVDMNRNYADPEDGPHPDGYEWQPETVLFMELAEENNFVMSANFHGGTEVCNYPWDTWSQYHPDDEWWQYVCGQYVDTVHAVAPSTYMTGYNNGITNGFEWYSISGGRQDYMNYFHQCREFTLEISDEKLLPASQLPDHWDYNYQSMLNYMEQALYGISGTVTDVSTNEPVMAEIYIEDHDADSSWVYSQENSGKYYRPLYAGNYTITFSAFGYYPLTVEDVQVENEELVVLDVELESGDLIVNFTASVTNISIGDQIDFSDMTFGAPTSWEWTFEGGIPNSSTEQNPQGILYENEGEFDVILTVSDGVNTMTVSKEDYISVSEEFIIENTTITSCSGTFYDSGGAEQNYNDQENFIMVFLPAVPDAKMSIDFTSFSVEYHVNCDYDWLKIYDGADIGAPLIGQYCGTDSPGLVTATNDEGALTFEFHSDVSVTDAGWIASIGCEGVLLPPVADFVASSTELIEGEEVQFSDLSMNEPQSWNWIFEGGDPATSVEENPEVTYNTPGLYDVSLTVTNTSGTNTLIKEDYITVYPWTGLDILKEIGVLAFPNPVGDKLTVQSKYPIHQLKLHNMSGMLVYESNPGNSEIIVPVMDLPVGIYILSVHTNNKIERRKLEIRH